MADATQTATLEEMLADAPRNWGRWGAGRRNRLAQLPDQ
jgi:hypothetical protein